jgi:signal transduction histidine kinase
MAEFGQSVRKRGDAPITGSIPRGPDDACQRLVAAEPASCSSPGSLLQTQRSDPPEELWAVLAHEISQPLTSIAITARLAHTRILSGKGDLAGAGDAFERIRHQSAQANDIIHHIYDLARGGVAPTTCCVADALVGAIMSTLASDAAQLGAKVTWHTFAGDAEILADATQMTLILTNLVMNAAQAMRDAGTTGPLVEVSTRLDGECVVLTVADNGPGLPKTSIDRLFEPFFSARRGGLGLGLSIARRIASAHGASLTACNRPDVQGALLTLRLPVRPQDQHT